MNSKAIRLLGNYISLVSNNRITMPLLVYALLVPFKFMLPKFGRNSVPSFMKRILLWSPLVRIKDSEHIFLARLSTGESLISKIDWEWERLKGLLREGYVVLDAGANIGKLTVKIARQVGSKGQVIAIEPNPVSYRILARNLELNNCRNSMALNVGVSSTRGRSVLVTDVLEPQATSMRQRGGSLLGHSTKKFIEMRTETVDWIISKYVSRRRVNVCKIDVEGAEMSVLKGSTNLLRTPSLNLWIEVHEPLVLSAEVRSFLKRNGFKTIRIRGIDLSSVGSIEKNKLVYVLAVKEDR